MRLTRALVCISIVAVVRLVVAQPPPLTEQQQIELETADDDDRGWTETAFRALVENARQWRPDQVAESATLPPMDELLASPAAHRGSLFALCGRLEQSTRLPAPYADVFEWFLRAEDGRPVQVFVINPRIHTPNLRFEPGTRVRVSARFYKRTGEVDRQGRDQRYAAFVGALPQPDVPDLGTTLMPLWLVALLLVAALLVFMFLLRRVRRMRAARRPAALRRVMDLAAGTETSQTELPDDPADALSELRRRAAANGDDEP